MQGCNGAPGFLSSARKPNPWHCAQEAFAKAIVNDLSHSIGLNFPSVLRETRLEAACTPRLCLVNKLAPETPGPTTTRITTLVQSLIHRRRRTSWNPGRSPHSKQHSHRQLLDDLAAGASASARAPRILIAGADPNQKLARTSRYVQAEAGRAESAGRCDSCNSAICWSRICVSAACGVSGS